MLGINIFEAEGGLEGIPFTAWASHQGTSLPLVSYFCWDDVLSTSITISRNYTHSQSQVV